MKTKKIKIILAAAALLFPILGIGQTAQAINCEWVKKTTNEGNPMAVAEGGCSTKENTACIEAKACDVDKRPAGYHLDQFTRISTEYMCCLSDNSELPDMPAPKFEIPELQIDIPGLDGKNFKFSAVTCTTEDGQNYKCAIPWIGEYIKAIYNYGFSIAGILAAIVLMAGGVIWLVSGGDAGKVTQAKELITGSVVGLVILAASYLILVEINPNLVNFKPITIGAVGDRQITRMINQKNSGKSESYRNVGCASDTELASGSAFYATGYCKPTWSNTEKFFCMIAMNCSCPNGKDTSKNCDKYFSKIKNYAPCNYFDEKTEYCNKTSSGQAPRVGSASSPGTIAGPSCSNLPTNTQVCFNGTTYIINDTGGAIQGKRIDIWTGNCADATKVTGAGTLTKGPCK